MKDDGSNGNDDDDHEKNMKIREEEEENESKQQSKEFKIKIEPYATRNRSTKRIFVHQISANYLKFHRQIDQIKTTCRICF